MTCGKPTRCRPCPRRLQPPRGPSPWELAALEQAVADMDTSLAADELIASAGADARFHARLVEASGNRRLIAFVASMVEQSQRVRRLTLHLRPRPTGSNANHRAVVEAIRARDPANAAILDRHRRQSGEMLVELQGRLRLTRLQSGRSGPAERTRCPCPRGSQRLASVKALALLFAVGRAWPRHSRRSLHVDKCGSAQPHRADQGRLAEPRGRDGPVQGQSLETPVHDIRQTDRRALICPAQRRPACKFRSESEKGQSPPRQTAKISFKINVVPEARFELAHLAAEDFESPASTVPPLGPRSFV